VSGAGDPHSERRDDLAAYAIGALGPAEREELKRHLADCERCRAYLRWLQPAVDVLPASVEQLAPPPALGERVMGAVREDLARQQAGEPAARRRAWRGLVLRPATALAAAGVLIAGGILGYALHDSGGGGPEPSLSATLAPAAGEARVAAENLPQPAAGDVYKLWVQHGQVMQPSKTFVPDPDGSFQTVLHGPLAGADAVAVTEEAKPSVRQPTLPPVISAAL
jgi:Anti-sigma-K factor rskA/Putative zinc-finger